MYRGVLCESLLGIFFSAAAWSQGLSTISGNISDPTGAMIPSARITVREVGTDLARTATTGPDGYYVMSSLRPTNYALTAEAPGFRTLSQTGITLLADESVTMNLRLEPGATTE